MASDKMPMLLDNHINDTMSVDLDHQLDVDLFGDAVLAMAPRPPSKELLRRVDELRARGCCRGIAWSKQGTIASISPDGQHIELRFLRVNPCDGVSWGLSDATIWPPSLDTLPGGPIVHLAWSTAGTPELTTIDAFGRVCILGFSLCLNRAFVTRRWETDNADNLHSVVGCYWLPLVPQSRQYNVIHGPAIRKGDQYEYKIGFTRALGPWHPNPAKSALACVTSNGLLKLFYPQNSNKYELTMSELESVSSSDDLVSHAAICSDRGNLLIALANSSRELKVVQAGIDWGMPPTTDKHQLPPGGVQLRPSLKENHVAVTSLLQNDTDESHLNASMTQISHLEILPPVIDMQTKSIILPTIYAVRSYVPATQLPYNSDVQSIIDRWEVVTDQSQELHSAFEQLGSRTGVPSSAAALPGLRKLEPIVVNKIIISINAMHFGRVLCIAFSDGTVQYRDRESMAEIYNEVDFHQIMALNQVGYHFAEEKPCLQVAFSPTNCSFVQISEDGKHRWNCLQYSGEQVEPSRANPQYAAAVAALTVAASSAAFQGMNYDDILACARTFSDRYPVFAQHWIQEIVGTLKINVDYSEEAHHDSLVRNAHLQFCLSILNHLDYMGEYKRRRFGGKLAMLGLYARNIVVLITVASNTPMNIKERYSPLDEPEVVDTLASCTKWALDLLAWLAESLFNLLDDPEFMELVQPNRFMEMTAYLKSHNDVSLHLILCSSTRCFLTALCRRLGHLDALSNRAMQYYEDKMTQNATDPGAAANQPPNPLQQAYIKLQRYTSESIINVREVEKLLLKVNTDIRSAYQTSLASLTGAAHQPQHQQQHQGPGGKQAETPAAKAQAYCELQLLLADSSGPPHLFFPVLKSLFHKDLKAFRDKTDKSRLFFADFELLEVEDRPERLAARKAKALYVDLFKRVGMKPVKSDEKRTDGNEQARDHGPGGPAPWRRCVRCAAVMEDSVGQRPGITFVLAQQRRCACGGHWYLLPRGELVI